MNESNLKERCLGLITTDLALEDTGIYAKSCNGVKRTDWQDGWNACAIAISEKATLISSFLKELPEKVTDYIISEKIGISVNDESVEMFVNCNDLFYWGWADLEEFKLSDLESFNNALNESPKNGDLLWCCRKRKMRPQKPYYKSFTDQEKLLFDACGPEREE